MLRTYLKTHFVARSSEQAIWRGRTSECHQSLAELGCVEHERGEQSHGAAQPTAIEMGFEIRSSDPPSLGGSRPKTSSKLN